MDLDEADLAILSLIDDFEGEYGLPRRQAVLLLQEKINAAARDLDDFEDRIVGSPDPHVELKVDPLITTLDQTNAMLARTLSR